MYRKMSHLVYQMTVQVFLSQFSATKTADGKENK